MQSLGIALALASLFVPHNALVAQTPAQDKPVEKPKPASIYDESADAKKVIADAVAHAKKENRRVLVQWGANWCHWCVKLHGLYKSDKAIAKEMLYEYDLVLVDIGEKGKNEQNHALAAQYGADLGQGVPYLTVLDGDGKVLANQETGALEDPAKVDSGGAHDATKVLGFLTQYQAKPWVAEEVRTAAFARAKAEHKLVFEHFGAPWCGWCHKLEDWMAQPAIASLLAKDFIDLKIDQDRMTGGADMLKAQRASVAAPEQGIPWIAFCNADGKILAHSDATNPKGELANTGFPAEDFEIAHFVKMLESVRINLTPADIETLRLSLVAEHEKIEAARAKPKPAAAGAGVH